MDVQSIFTIVVLVGIGAFVMFFSERVSKGRADKIHKSVGSKREAWIKGTSDTYEEDAAECLEEEKRVE